MRQTITLTVALIAIISGIILLSLNPKTAQVTDSVAKLSSGSEQHVTHIYHQLVSLSSSSVASLAHPTEAPKVTTSTVPHVSYPSHQISDTYRNHLLLIAALLTAFGITLFLLSFLGKGFKREKIIEVDHPTHEYQHVIPVRFGLPLHLHK